MYNQTSLVLSDYVDRVNMLKTILDITEGKEKATILGEIAYLEQLIERKEQKNYER